MGEIALEEKMFSVIVPAHNAESTIRKCLDSIKNQTFKNYELIVVCDACTDKTVEIAKKYTYHVAEVNFHSDGPTRSVGLDMAKGKWVLFMDADDWYLHEFCFEILAKKLNEVDAKTDVLVYSIIWKHIGYTKPRSVKDTLYPHCTNKCWRRSFIGVTRFPDKYVANDAGFHEAMMKKEPRLYEWDMPIYYYDYLNGKSKSDEIGRTAENTKQYWSTH